MTLMLVTTPSMRSACPAVAWPEEEVLIGGVVEADAVGGAAAADLDHVVGDVTAGRGQPVAAVAVVDIDAVIAAHRERVLLDLEGPVAVMQLDGAGGRT